MAHTRLKICCIRDLDEARIAVEAGADALGLVGPMPSGPGQIGIDTVRAVIATLPAGVSSWLLTTAIESAEIIGAARLAHAQVIQLVRAVEPSACDAVRAEMPHLRLVSVIHVQGESALDEAARIAPHVHGVLLDSGKPHGEVPTYGGTGDTHDWDISRRIVAAVDGPVWLAGGLTPENVGAAIRQVRPFGVDVCSKLRTGGRLDPARVAAFTAAIRRADG